MTPFLKTTESYRPGARTMPGRYYTAPEVFAAEADAIFRSRWICVGRAAQLLEPGAYLLPDIAGESVIVLRDRSESRSLRAFYNVCRHRGTRLCEAPARQGGGGGRLAETIQCPYHAWTYALDGRLIGAPHMQEVAGFSKADYPLHAVALDTWEGFVFVSLARDPVPLATVLAPLTGRFARYNLPALTAVRRIEYDVRANWKLILQNYSECLHCPTIHPELSDKLPYTSGANDLVEGPFLGGYMEIKAPHASATISGRACALPLGELSAEDAHRAFYYTIFPTMMLSLHPDYAVFYTVWPRSPLESRVVCEWLVHPDAPGAPEYNIADAEEFWDRTNRQDWHICERSQLGIGSRVYQPGPYSPRESIPAAWDREYLRTLGSG
jgi:phenylpropionate dioxygenase-like ring-hydroxylating dioxygenase large terminal subunit